MSGVATANVSVPIKLLHEGEGHAVTVEMKNGEIYRGHLNDAEDTMNCFMTGGKLVFSQRRSLVYRVWSHATGAPLSCVHTCNRSHVLVTAASSYSADHNQQAVLLLLFEYLRQRFPHGFSFHK